MTGYLCKYYGWPSVFYASGCVITAFGIIYCAIVTNNPEDHLLISKKERKYIYDNIAKVNTNQKLDDLKTQQIPWKQMMTCVPLWASI